MRSPKCTIDSSCLIALDHLDLIPKLSLLFSEVLVPKAVRQDLFKRRSTKDRVRALFDQYAFFKPCNEYDKVAVDILLVERTRKGLKDRGEAEAVVQAAQIGASVIVDDKWGRDLAASHAISCNGTLWVLKQLFNLQLIGPSDLKNHFLSLRRRRYFLPWEQVNDFLLQVGQQPIKP